MNEVKKCSLAGIAFTMDKEAFEALSSYLETLKKSYKNNPDGAEIVADIEARIAELILTAQDQQRVVGLPLIQEIIRQMGSAEDIHEEEGTPTAEPQHTTEERLPRRLYRDGENAKLGGVCAGVGRYFDVDPVWIRLALFVPLLLSCMSGLRYMDWIGPLMGNTFGVCVIGYLVMWFAVPVARTARQKLEMQGERITAESISRTAEQQGMPDGEAKTVVASTVSVFGKIVLILLKIAAGVIVFGLVLMAVALLIGLITVCVGGAEIIPNDLTTALPILGILTVFLPIVMIIYALMCLIASRRPNGKIILGIFILWLLNLIALMVIAIRDDVKPQLEHHVEEVIETQIEINGETVSANELFEQIEREGKLKVNGPVKIKSKQNQEVSIEIDENQQGANLTIEADGKRVTIEANEQP